MNRIPDRATESRIEEIRRQAELFGRVDGKGVRPQGAPMPAPNVPEPSAQSGYYGLPLLKQPVWTWEIPTYFFIGGAAGAAALLGAVAQASGADAALVRDARWIAAGGANLSAPLLIGDLGRPERFLAMMRVFKPQSAMSVGAWTLAAFGAFSSAAAFADEIRRRTNLPVTLIGDAAAALSAATGLAMMTYTGVLIGATSIPVWSKHARVLPAHFGVSGLGSALSILQLRGHDDQALNALGIVCAAFETYTGSRIERDETEASDPLRKGHTGQITRIGGVLSGPVPFLLRVLGMKSRKLQKLASVCTLAGSLITRFAWVEAGKISARDPRGAVGLATTDSYSA